MASEDILGDLVPSSRIQKLRLREVHQTNVQDEHSTRVLASVYAYETPFSIASSVRLPLVQREHQTNVGRRGKQARWKVDHQAEERCH